MGKTYVIGLYKIVAEYKVQQLINENYAYYQLTPFCGILAETNIFETKCGLGTKRLVTDI